MRFFNTAGPIVSEDHYYVPIADRMDIDEIMSLIDQEKYFILHAPRQSGKTSSLLALMKILNESGKYKCLYVNVEGAQVARENVEMAIRAIIESLVRSENIYLGESIIENNSRAALKKGGLSALESILTCWAQESSLQTVLFIDEIDSLVGDSLISVLRQLRSGYAARPHAFPQSIILCGIRDVRDYRIHASKDKEIITGGSCYNINAKSLRLGNFSEKDIRNLYLQHTKETGQEFTEEAIKFSYELTNGQPWLVNALAYEACFEMREGKDRKNAVTKEMINTAKEDLILRRVTHLDQLVDKLKEDRVQRIIEPMLKGDDFKEFVQDDIQYSIDLGLISKSPNGLVISNMIYSEIIPRELAIVTQTRIESKVDRLLFVNPDGSLNIEKLLEYFKEFFRENSESWIERFDYKEAGPQLLLQAFLQRVVNGGGRIFREYGLGRMRTDLLIEWHDKKKYVIELKVLHKSLENTISEGIRQTWMYMDKTGADIGHLLIFDKGEGKSWEEKIFRQDKEYNGKRIAIWGM